jgi:hypothetical protein
VAHRYKPVPLVVAVERDVAQGIDRFRHVACGVLGRNSL